MPSILGRAAYRGRNPALEAIHHARRAEAATKIEET